MAQKQFTEWWMPLLENVLGREYPSLKAALSVLREIGDKSSHKAQSEIGEWYGLVAFYGGVFSLDRALAPAPEKPAPATGNRVKCRSRNRRARFAHRQLKPTNNPFSS
jgi:hypothetical protein